LRLEESLIDIEVSSVRLAVARKKIGSLTGVTVLCYARKCPWGMTRIRRIAFVVVLISEHVASHIRSLRMPHTMREEILAIARGIAR
jgi:hypothetical protein